jgi:MoxR-like ATPase
MVTSKTAVPLATSAPLATPPEALHELIDRFLSEVNRVILDKEHEIALTLCAILAKGHLLIEDIPGVGKTTLVKTLARLMALETSRIQFTNDLLPADILGNSIFDSEKKTFVFHKGPLFSQVVLADELNRATPKTQSACLQAMEEHRISVDGVTYALPEPFFVIATQNPRQHIGTFPLPESQLDRFLMRLTLGYPSREAERRLLLGESRQEMLDEIKPVLSGAEIIQMQVEARKVHVSEALVDYIQDLVDKTRQSAESPQGLSPRGALGLLHSAQAWAFLKRRSEVLPEDVQAVAVAIMSHRLNPVEDLSGETGQRLAEEILASVRVD